MWTASFATLVITLNEDTNTVISFWFQIHKRMTTEELKHTFHVDHHDLGVYIFWIFLIVELRRKQKVINNVYLQ